MVSMAMASLEEALARTYRDLVPAEARLAEALARRGLALRSSVVDQWPTLHDHIRLYARSLSPAGLLVLGGRPDEGSRATGIPFTGAPEARRYLGLDVPGAQPSPSGAAFWRALDAGRPEGAALEAFFATAHLAHAVPYDAPDAPELLEASAGHVLRLLAETRPQAVVAVGTQPLRVLARALLSTELRDLAACDEDAWADRWPAGTPLHRRPSVAVPGPRPFRTRLVPIPSLEGPHADGAYRILASTLATAWA